MHGGRNFLVFSPLEASPLSLRVASDPPSPASLAAGAYAGWLRDGIGCRPILYSSRVVGRVGLLSLVWILSVMASGVMPFCFLLCPSSSGGRDSPLIFACCGPWRMAAWQKGAGGSSLNKLDGYRSDGLRARQCFFPSFATKEVGKVEVEECGLDLWGWKMGGVIYSW